MVSINNTFVGNNQGKIGYYLVDLRVDGRIIITCILQKLGMAM
jgi:hypothetical protein